MSAGLLLLAFLAGVITIFAPCVFTLLPAIVGGGLDNPKDKGRPLRIAFALSVSIFVFTMILRVATNLINDTEGYFEVIGGGIIFFLGIVTIFPELWDWIAVKLRFNQKANQALSDASQKKNIWGDFLVGAALGPVFTSCSPTYLYILTEVTVNNSISNLEAIILILAYIFGLAIMLSLIGIGGQRIVQRLKWAADPHGKFKRALGVLFIIVGWSIMFGLHKDIQEFIVSDLPFLDITQIEGEILQEVIE